MWMSIYFLLVQILPVKHILLNMFFIYLMKTSFVILNIILKTIFYLIQLNKFANKRILQKLKSDWALNN